MSTLLKLPDLLYLEILSFAEDKEKLEFAKISKYVSRQIVKFVRQVKMMNSSNDRIFQDKAYRDKLLGLINNPSKQLQFACLNAPYNLPGPETKLSFAFLQIHMGSCRFLSLPSWIDRVPRLGLIPISRGSADKTSAFLRSYIEEVNQSNMGVKEFALTYNCREVVDVPVVKGLESLEVTFAPILKLEGLHLSDYTSLHSLTLVFCPGIEDINCLGRIPTLTLSQCDNIHDISSLNYNNIIKIIKCNRISNYSKAFQYSKYIEIYLGEASSVALEHSLLGPLQEAIRLTIFVHKNFEINKLPTLEINAPLLKRLEISNYRCLPSSISILSPNCIIVLKLSNCSESGINLVDFTELRVIEIDQMQISSLEGITTKLLSAKISQCDLITDFSFLSQCNSIQILDCDSLMINSINLERVKYLKVKPKHQSMSLLEYNGVTSLEITLPTELDELIQLRSLKDLVLHCCSEHFLLNDSHQQALLMQAVHIQRVVLVLVTIKAFPLDDFWRLSPLRFTFTFERKPLPFRSYGPYCDFIPQFRERREEYILLRQT